MISYILMNINDLSVHDCEFWSLKYLIFIYACILLNIARKCQGKSVTSYLLMNINDLDAMAVNSAV